VESLARRWITSAVSTEWGIEVIVDPDDDLATATAIRTLAAREPAMIAVSIAPATHAEAPAIWAILRALGKRVDHLERCPPKVY
jgi:hypothetical protein